MAKSFVQHINDYYAGYNTPSSKLDSRTQNIDESRQRVSRVTEGVVGIGELSRVFNGFPSYLDEKEITEFENKIRETVLNPDIAETAPSKATPDQTIQHFERRITNHQEIAEFIQNKVNQYVKELFDIDKAQKTIHLKKDLEMKLGITEELYTRHTKIKVLQYIYASFVNEFIFHNSREFDTEIFNPEGDLTLRHKHSAFSMYQNVIVNKTLEQLFAPFQKTYADRIKETFDDVYNHEKEYTSRIDAFFGLKPPYITALFDTALNVVKLATEFIPSVIKATGDHLAAWCDNRLELPPDERTTGWWKTPCAYAGKYFVAPLLQTVGWVGREVGMTFTSPKRAIQETYSYVKQKTGSRILGGIAAFFLRIVPLAAVVLTVGLPALPVLLTKVGGSSLATAASTIKYGLGYAGGWVASHLGVSGITANAAASVSAKATFTAVSPVVSSVIGTNFVFQAVSAFFKKTWAACKSIYEWCKPNETYRHPNADKTPGVPTFKITSASSPQIYKKYQALFSARGMGLPPEGMTQEAMDAALANAPSAGLSTQGMNQMMAAASSAVVATRRPGPSSRASVTTTADSAAKPTDQTHGLNSSPIIPMPASTDVITYPPGALAASQQSSGLIASSPPSQSSGVDYSAPPSPAAASASVSEGGATSSTPSNGGETTSSPSPTPPLMSTPPSSPGKSI